MSTDWNVARHGEACTGCARTFEVNETFSAVLYPDGERGFARRDYCADCEPSGDPPAVGQWKARRAPPSEPKTAPFDRAAMFEFFVRMDAATPEKLQFRFALALLLWRKKLLKFSTTSYDDEGREVWNFDVPRDGGSYPVVKPDLDEDQIETLSAQLEALVISGTAPVDPVAAETGGGEADE